MRARQNFLTFLDKMHDLFPDKIFFQEMSGNMPHCYLGNMECCVFSVTKLMWVLIMFSKEMNAKALQSTSAIFSVE